MVRQELLLGLYRFNAQAGAIAQAVILLVVKAEVIAWDISRQSVKAAIAA